MKKEDAIKEHWSRLIGEDKFDQLRLDENGFSDWRCRKIVPTHRWCELFDKLRPFTAKRASGADLLYRPKTLKGIEDNNGWTKINSKGDLPKIGDNYLFLVDGREVVQWCEDGTRFSNRHTHWREIVINPKPLY